MRSSQVTWTATPASTWPLEARHSVKRARPSIPGCSDGGATRHELPGLRCRAVMPLPGGGQIAASSSGTSIGAAAGWNTNGMGRSDAHRQTPAKHAAQGRQNAEVEGERGTVDDGEPEQIHRSKPAHPERDPAGNRCHHGREPLRRPGAKTRPGRSGIRHGSSFTRRSDQRVTHARRSGQRSSAADPAGPHVPRRQDRRSQPRSRLPQTRHQLPRTTRRTDRCYGSMTLRSAETSRSHGRPARRANSSTAACSPPWNSKNTTSSASMSVLARNAASTPLNRLSCSSATPTSAAVTPGQ